MLWQWRWMNSAPRKQTVKPIRIVHAISSPAAGGAEVYVKDLANALARRGHKPAILFLSRSADIGRTDSFEKAFLADLDASNIPYAFLGHECRRNPLLGAIRTRRFVKSHGADIYHSHLKYSLLFGAGLGVPHVHTHHNVRRHAPAWMWPLFNRIVDAWVGISELCAERLRLFSGRPVTMIRNAVDPRRLGAAAVRVRTVADQGVVRCIAVGSPGEQKNFGLLVDALALLPAEILQRVTLDIVGEGSPEATAALAGRIEAAGLGRTVRLSGTSNRVLERFQDADLFLMSSAWEGMPIALLEASMAGLPFIATDVGGCAEVARLCGNGLIVPPGDAAAFSDALAGLVADPIQIEALSRSALAAAAIFSIDASAKAHIALYERLLQAPLRRSTSRRNAE
jgi:glycosyltransferase involved in cell wall biosynthesis